MLIGAYDLYGNWYLRQIDARNAEEIQCNQINNTRQDKEIDDLTKRLEQLEEIINTNPKI